jgi:hypothetical protein
MKQRSTRCESWPACSLTALADTRVLYFLVARRKLTPAAATTRPSTAIGQAGSEGVLGRPGPPPVVGRPDDVPPPPVDGTPTVGGAEAVDGAGLGTTAPGPGCVLDWFDAEAEVAVGFGAGAAACERDAARAVDVMTGAPAAIRAIPSIARNASARAPPRGMDLLSIRIHLLRGPKSRLRGLAHLSCHRPK